MAGLVDAVEQVSQLPSEWIDDESEDVTEEGRRRGLGAMVVSLLRTLDLLEEGRRDEPSDISDDVEDEVDETRFLGARVLADDLPSNDGLEEAK